MIEINRVIEQNASGGARPSIRAWIDWYRNLLHVETDSYELATVTHEYGDATVHVASITSRDAHLVDLRMQHPHNCECDAHP
jgi:hypothetical protein